MNANNDSNAGRTMNTVLTNVFIESHVDEYKGFFDHAWAKAIDSRTSGYPQLDSAVGEFLFSLKATSNAFRFPWLTVHLHSGFVSSFVDAGEPLQIECLKLIRARLRAAATSPDAGKVIEPLMDEATTMMLQIQSQRREMVDENLAENAFAQYLTATEFQVAIIGLMRNTFASLVFAYEHFFLTCFRLRSNDPDAQSIPANQFRTRVHDTFGQSVAEECWTGDEIRKYFEIRNALAHQGGRFSSRLDRWESEIFQLDGGIQITASQNRKLFHFIKQRADILIDHILKWHSESIIA